MRRLFITFLLLSAPPFSAAIADDIESVPPEAFDPDRIPGPVCHDCRDPYEYPMDFVAYGFNEFFGDTPSLFGSGIGWPFRVYNQNNESVLIWFENVLFDMPSLLPNLLDVMVRFENGQVMTFTVIQDGPDLPIGDSEAPSGDCTCGGGGDGGSADGDEYEEAEEHDDYEYEEPEYDGVVEIEDPDEDGEFEPWEEEL